MQATAIGRWLLLGVYDADSLKHMKVVVGSEPIIMDLWQTTQRVLFSQYPWQQTELPEDRHKHQKSRTL